MKHVLLGAALAIWPVLLIAQTDAVQRPVARSAKIDQLLVESSAAQFAFVEGALSGAEKLGGLAGNPLPGFKTDLRPPARNGNLPRTRWRHMAGNEVWTRAALSALKDHGKALVDLVPADIENWCPAYPGNPAEKRRAFWVGFMSALAKHESTYKPWAVGGGGKWYGLLQILPGTARGYQCRVRTGAALKNGAANLSCAVRIMAHTVPRDGVIHGYRGRRGRGVTADWGPMHSASKRRDMSRWLRQQSYCKPIGATRPKPRPAARAG